MKVEKTLSPVRAMNDNIKRCTSLDEINEQVTIFIENRNKLSLSDQAFLMTMLGLKMMKLVNGKDKFKVGVITAFKREPVYKIDVE